MNYLFVLSQENLDLSKAEVLALCDPKEIRWKIPYLILDVSQSSVNLLSKRLAFTKSVHRILFSCSLGTLVSKMEKFKWSQIISKDFAVRIAGTLNVTEKELGGIIFRTLKRPKVNLTNPTTLITIYPIDDEIHVCLRIHEQTEDFQSRRPHLRERNHPSSMHPRIARAIINLTGIRKGELIDPFCGSGGFLIEAGLMGLKPVGIDLEWKMLERAKENLKGYKFKNKLIEGDALKINRSLPFVATDLPYSQNTRNSPIGPLFKGFMRVLSDHLLHRAVVVVPLYGQKETPDYEMIVKEYGLVLKETFEQYVHHILTRKILLIEPKR